MIIKAIDFSFSIETGFVEVIDYKRNNFDPHISGLITFNDEAVSFNFIKQDLQRVVNCSVVVSDFNLKNIIHN